MAIAETEPVLPGPAATVRRRGPHAVAAAVLITGLIITATLAVVTTRAHQRNEVRLLALQTGLIGQAVLAADPLFIEAHLGGAVKLAAATGGDVPTFTRAMADSVGAKNSFLLASLWRVGGGSPQLITQVGARPLLVPGSAAATALLRQAEAAKSFLVVKLTGAHALRLGYAAAASGNRGSFVAYAEVGLPVSRRIPRPAGTPFSQLNLAIYLGHSQSGPALLETDSAAPLPLRGTTYTTAIPFGNTVLTLAASPRSSLTGSVGQVLPPALAIGGLLLSVLVALLTERLIRRREKAERLTDEVGRLYLEQRSVAETLQHALLPQQTPVIPGMDIAVRYLPGVGAGADIGGDWYDVVPLGDDSFVFVVGDVSGRGTRAAATMASLHYASRAYALEGHPPTVILAQLARILDIGTDGQFATVLCGLVRVDAHEVTLASAGHLPPLVCGSGGARIAWTKPGSPIGIATDGEFEPATLTTAAKDTLIAYTDGLIERRGESLDTGMTRLADAAAWDAPLEDMLSSIVTKLTGDSPADDIALIGLRWLN